MEDRQPSIAAKAVLPFVEAWNYEQRSERQPDERQPPSLCDFAARLGITVEDALTACREAESFGLVWISDPGFLFEENPHLSGKR